VKGLSKH